MIQRIWGRIRLFLLLCGIWGALFFTIANVNGHILFYPTMFFYVLYRIGHMYVLFLLLSRIAMNGERIRRRDNKTSDQEGFVIILLFMILVVSFFSGTEVVSSRWWRILEYPPNIDTYYASYKDWLFISDLTDLFSFSFLSMCFLNCCMPFKILSAIILLKPSEVFNCLLPYKKKDSGDIYDVQQYEYLLDSLIPDKKIFEKSNSFVKTCSYIVKACSYIVQSFVGALIVIVCFPFAFTEKCLKIMLGKYFMLKMVGDYDQAEMSKIKNQREEMFWDRMSMYLLFIFAGFYIPLEINNIFLNQFNINIRGVGLFIGIVIAAIIIIWAEYDNLIVTKNIHEQEIFDISKNNKNWMLLYAHQLINTGKTIYDDVSLLREKDEIEIRLDNLQVNTQLLLDDGEKCLNYALALSKQPVKEDIDLIALCKKVIIDIEDDRKTAAFCIEDDILIEYSGDETLFLVKTDENILQKILYELIANAVSYRIPSTAVTITIEKKGSVIQMIIENAVTLKDAEKMQEYLHKIDAFWNWQNVSSAGDIRLGLVFTKGYAEMVDIKINYDVKNKITFSADLEIPIA